MKLWELADIEPTPVRDFIHFGIGPHGHAGPPNSSPLDIFTGKHSSGRWLDTMHDAETLAAMIRMAIKIAYTLDPNEPLAALRLIPNLIGPDAFGGPDKLQKLNEWTSKIQINQTPQF